MIQSADAVRIVLIGIGATAILDLWVLALNKLGVATLPLALIGRWLGHAVHGRFVHAAIRQATPIPCERPLGWVMHYLVGIGFAVILVGVAGSAWLVMPTIAPALGVGAASVAMPLLVMQPAMGTGFMSSRTANPVRNVLRSVLNHLVMGLGFYVAAMVMKVLEV